MKYNICTFCLNVVDTPPFYASASQNLFKPDFRDGRYKPQNVLTYNGDVYYPNNGMITILETEVWTLTISVGSNKENAFSKLYHKVPRQHRISQDPKSELIKPVST